MKFGSLYELQPGPRPWKEPHREQQVYLEALDQIKLTEELGWDYAWAVEHHFLDGYSLNTAPEVFLGWVAGQTSRIRLAHGVVLAAPTINHPFRIAERVAALDVMSNGRVEFGAGRGLTIGELEAFGVDPETTRTAQVDLIKVLPHLWNDEPFSFEGELYSLPERAILPRPIQDPHPPLWLACTQPKTWELAGRLGCGVLAFGFTPPTAVRHCIADYRRAVAEAVTPYGVVNNQIAFAPPTFCAPTDEEAWETFGPHYAFHVQTGIGFVQDWASTKAKSYEFYGRMAKKIPAFLKIEPDFDSGLSPGAALVKAATEAGLCAVGSPERCRQLAQLYVDCGIDQMICTMQHGLLSNDDLKRSIRLFSQEVMPEFAGSSATMAVSVS